MSDHAEITESAEAVVHCRATGPLRICVEEEEPTITIADLEDFCRAARVEGAEGGMILESGRFGPITVRIKRDVAPL